MRPSAFAIAATAVILIALVLTAGAQDGAV
jgi:hypothetical protein